MRILWAASEASVASVHEQLEKEREIAFTTVSTMLRKMEDRGLVEHRAEGRRYLYRPLVAEDAVTRSMAEDLLERFFDGSVAAMVSHFLSTREISADELKQLQKMVRDRKAAK